METIWQCENCGCGQGIAQAVLTRDFAIEVKWMGFNYDDQFYITGRLRMNDREYYVSVLTVGAYSIGGPLKGRVFTQLDVVESKGMQEGMVTLSSDKLLTAVENEGRVAVYGIHFEFDKAIVKPESYPQLDEIAKMLNKTDGQFLVVGHTDNKGELEYNQRLSDSRAESVIRALSERGVSSARLIPIGVGMASPVASNTTEEGRAKNRRVEIVKR